MWFTGRVVSKPAMWGKLPNHADYIAYGASGKEVQGWQQWMKQHAPADVYHTSTRQVVKTAAVRRRHHWISLDAPKDGLRYLACAFILPPKALSFAPDQYVIGVMIPSNDSIGRKHLLIVYQRANRRWLQEYLSPAAALRQDWLFWLAKLISELVAQQAGGEGPAAEGSVLTAVKWVYLLWALHAPRWRQKLLAEPLPRPDADANERILQQIGEYHETGPLHGVANLPWPDWPERVLSAQPLAAFWQYDHAGHYVNAADSLSQLWRNYL